jgi:hypothetical protein
MDFLIEDTWHVQLQCLEPVEQEEWEERKAKEVKLLFRIALCLFPHPLPHTDISVSTSAFTLLNLELINKEPFAEVAPYDSLFCIQFTLRQRKIKKVKLCL